MSSIVSSNCLIFMLENQQYLDQKVFPALQNFIFATSLQFRVRLYILSGVFFLLVDPYIVMNVRMFEQ